MHELSNTVFAYYLGHLPELPFEKQFHFASRLYLWTQHSDVRTPLERLRPWFTAHDNPEDALRQTVAYAAAHPFLGSKNVEALRRPHFARYPKLTTYGPALFKILFLKTVYGIDCRDLFFRHFPEGEVEQLAEDLLADNEALAYLSTHAVNFLYLYRLVVRGDGTAMPLDSLISAAQTYLTTEDRHTLQLLLYFYTHCIIAQTEFYYRPIPAPQLASYRHLVTELEQLIEQHFEDTNLDNKFEFLVCCRITGRQSKLAERILDEARQSISAQGSFLIDRRNNNPQIKNQNLDKSEHRNTLFIMSASEFHPPVISGLG